MTESRRFGNGDAGERGEEPLLLLVEIVGGGR